MAYRGYSGAKTNKWGDCSSKTLFRQRKLRDLGKAEEKEKQKVGNLLGLSPHEGLQSMGCSRQGVLGCGVWGLFFPFAHVQRQLPPGKAGRGVGQECILPLGDATLPTLQLSTHRRSSEESEETRDRRSPRISAKEGKGLVTTCSPAGSC